MNRVIYPTSSYPLSGDLESHPGDTNTLVVGIQGVPVSQVTLADGLVLTFVAAVSSWVPTPSPIATTSSLGVVQPDGITITVDSGGVIRAPGGAGRVGLPHDVTTTRSFGLPFQNTNPNDMWVTGYALTAGSSTGDITVEIGPTNTTGQPVFGNSFTATVIGGKAAFGFWVPAGYFYQATATGAISGGVGLWVEYF